MKLRTLLKCLGIAVAAGIQPAWAGVEPLGDPEPFKDPLVFIGDVLAPAGNLVYWVLPYPEDTQGRAAVKQYLDVSHSNNYRENPLAIQIRIAGLEIPQLGEDTSKDLMNDDYAGKSEAKIDAMAAGHTYQFTCYGAYSNRVVPYCSFVDHNGVSLGVTVLEQGLAVPGAPAGLGDHVSAAELQAAQKRAQDAQVGVWKPFHFLMRGLK